MERQAIDSNGSGTNALSRMSTYRSRVEVVRRATETRLQHGRSIADVNVLKPAVTVRWAVVAIGFGTNASSRCRVLKPKSR